MEVGPVDEVGRTRCRAVARRVARKLDYGEITPMALDDVPKAYGGAKRLRYERAVEELKVCGLSSNDFRLEAFVKAEKLDIAAEAKAPRMIQFRSFKFNAAFMSHYLPCEHRLLSLRSLKCQKIQQPSRVIAKGLNGPQRYALLEHKWSQFKNPNAIGIDCSRFDAHVREEMQRLEGLVYRRWNKSQEFRSLLDKQLTMKGRTRSGVKYSLFGGRASGDVNTGGGNSLQMLLMLVASLEDRGYPFEFVVDGDDAVVIIDASNVEDAERSLRDFFVLCGHVLTFEFSTSEFLGIKFGQSHPILTTGGGVMVRDHARALGRTFISHKHLGEPVGGRKFLRAVVMCEAHLARGVPVLQEYFQKMLRLLGPGPAHFHLLDDWRYQTYLDGDKSLLNVDPLPISDTCRDQFARAMGVEVDHQRLLEAVFRDLRDPFDLTRMELSGYWRE